MTVAEGTSMSFLQISKDGKQLTTNTFE